MMNPELQKYFDVGALSEKNNKNAYDAYKFYFGEPIGNSPEWIACLEGTYSVRKEIADRKRKEYNVEEFLEKLQALCNEYDASIQTACVDGGFRIKDYEDSISISPQK